MSCHLLPRISYPDVYHGEFFFPRNTRFWQILIFFCPMHAMFQVFMNLMEIYLPTYKKISNVYKKQPNWLEDIRLAAKNWLTLNLLKYIFKWKKLMKLVTRGRCSPGLENRPLATNFIRKNCLRTTYAHYPLYKFPGTFSGLESVLYIIILNSC